MKMTRNKSNGDDAVNVPVARVILRLSIELCDSCFTFKSYCMTAIVTKRFNGFERLVYIISHACII